MLHLETAIEKFSNAHKLLHQNLHDEDDIHESNDYFNTEMDRIADLKQNVNECNERLMLVSDMHNIRPEDSVSSVGLRQKSHARNISQRSMAGSNISGASTSTSSSISLSKVKAAAKKARLLLVKFDLCKRNNFIYKDWPKNLSWKPSW
jgi:superfamily I DNA and RNA helicase